MPVDFGLYSQKRTATGTSLLKFCAHSRHSSLRVGKRAAWTWASMRGMPSSTVFPSPVEPGSRDLSLADLSGAGLQQHLRVVLAQSRRQSAEIVGTHGAKSATV